MFESLSYDGRGINDRDEYRSRLATFANDEAGNKYGRVFAVSPELFEACELALELLDNSDVRHYISTELGEQAKLHKAINAARAAIRKVTA
jgi:hypothetical protein